ncbi:MAG: ATP-binding protein [Desulfobacteraceae bacterium]|jgi:two-component system sensor histidine kinase HydH
MTTRPKSGLLAAMRSSPWIILGSTAILLVVVIVLSVQNTSREKRYMTKILSAKGAALIRAVEAGARTGMMGTMWGGRQIQRLLEETGRLPDVVYMALVDPEGRIVAHSDSSKIDTFFRADRKLVHLGPDLQENWELVETGVGGPVFEVHRHFRPLMPRRGHGGGHMPGMMHRRPRGSAVPDEWFGQEQLLIVAGLDVAPFQAAIRDDIRNTVIFSVILLLLGFGGFVSLFWMNSYRAAKRSLQDTSAFADEVVTHLPVGLIATDRQGRITFFNAAAERITGLTYAQAADRKPDGLLPEQLCGLAPALDSGDTIVEREMECAFSGGNSAPLSVSATRIVNEIGQFVGHVLILRDLGEVRRLKDEVRRQEKLAALGGLAAGVAHEIRNPLSSIKGLATFFQEQFADGSEAREAAGVMIREVDRLNRVISELLDFARPTDLNRRLSDLPPLINRSIQLIQQDAASQNITIEVHISDDIRPVSIDPDRLTQCLLNLYLNALQAMAKGGTLTVGCHLEDGGRKVRITVSDTGEGIAAEHRNAIFNPYFTTKNKGTGLGLAIVHKIIEAHQAHLNVESTPGKGTRIMIEIPL